LVALDEPQYRPHIITEKFWRGWDAYRRAALFSFKGRPFGVPLLELAGGRLLSASTAARLTCLCSSWRRSATAFRSPAGSAAANRTSSRGTATTTRPIS